MQGWLRRKDIDQVTVHEEGRRLVPTLGWPHLIALGIGAIVGTGIYTLIGVGANLAGPGVLLSFLVAGIVCACAALAYAELATMMPAAGSAYTYSYAVLGETIAWVVGWSLILEYTLVVSTVAVGWSGYFVGFLDGLGVHLPLALTVGPHAGGLLNLPAIFITCVVAGLLVAGTRESATLNAVLVVAKLIALAVFVAIALPAFDASNLQPFMPHGFAESVGPDGKKYGVMAAAAIIFFAFYGFDAISTAAEETRNPGRDLSIGIVGSMVGCTIIYMLVALAAVGAMRYSVFGQSPEPLAMIMRGLGHAGAAKIVAAAAVVALPTVLLAFFYGQSRIFFVMSRDGLLPRNLSKVGKRGTPIAITVFTAIVRHHEEDPALPVEERQQHRRQGDHGGGGDDLRGT
ncbi:MAG: amino acid permease, partial [Lysobacteraceae bacterium]